MSEELPIGTVVELKDKNGEYLIIGRNVKKGEEKYDYSCVTYPYGYVENEDFIYVQEEDVISIVFLGDINT